MEKNLIFTIRLKKRNYQKNSNCTNFTESFILQEQEFSTVKHQQPVRAAFFECNRFINSGIPDNV